MIEFSQPEIKELIAIVRSQIDFLDNADLPEPEELQSILSKLKAAQIKPQSTADMFGIDRQQRIAQYDADFAAMRQHSNTIQCYIVVDPTKKPVLPTLAATAGISIDRAESDIRGLDAEWEELFQQGYRVAIVELEVVNLIEDIIKNDD